MPKVSASQVKQAGLSVQLNAKKFSEALTKVAQLKAGLTSAVLTKATAELVAEIQRESPVDTGQFRGGWSPFLQSLGMPSNIPGGDTRAVAKGFAMSDYNDESERMVDPHIFIRNGVPYGPELEAGKSSQSGGGGGFVAASLARFSKHLNAAARTVSAPRGGARRDSLGRFM